MRESDVEHREGQDVSDPIKEAHHRKACANGRHEREPHRPLTDPQGHDELNCSFKDITAEVSFLTLLRVLAASDFQRPFRPGIL